MTKRNLLPGEEWVYYKIYTNIRNADFILVTLLKPFLRNIQENGAATDFFFVRYKDPDFHIRLRIKLSCENSYSHIFRIFNDSFGPLISEGMIQNVCIDTYQREIERYAPIDMASIETIFSIDSKHIIDLISILSNHDDSGKLRWLIAMALVEDTLEAFNFDHNEKYYITNLILGSYLSEFKMNSSLYTKPLNLKYRRYKEDIIIFLQKGENYTRLKDTLDSRRGALRIVIDKINESTPLATSGNYQSLISSIIHMSLNRLFRNDNTVCEMVTYYMLNKHYKNILFKGEIGT